jgi:uncharacterized protein YbaP (TraB family)
MRALLFSLLAAAGWMLGACAPAAEREPALWRIADADSEIWLFGSVHLLPPELRWRGPRINAAFAAADELVTETDIPGAETAAVFETFIASHGQLPPGQSLSQLLEPGDAAQLAQAARTLGFSLPALERERPWLVALRLSYADLVRSGQSAEAGVETVLGAEARRQGKRMTTLETPEQQLGVLAGLAPADERRFLSLTLREIGAQDEITQAMDQAWASGDVAALEALFETQWREAGPALHEAIILERNRAWANAIERRLAGSGRVFIAVGAAHLIGEGSVVELLRARGIAVEGP